jgi:cytochrome c oxidase subunit 2
MPIVLEVMTKEDYASWLAGKKREIAHETIDEQRIWSVAELMEHGESVYATQCAACHQQDGSGLAPAFPALTGSAVINGPIDEQIEVVMNGREGTAMQAWGGLLSASDIAAALTYTRNAFGQEADTAVQPQTIARIKNG